MGESKEECGIGAVRLRNVNSNSRVVWTSLNKLLEPIQRRGQSGTGTCVWRLKESKYRESFCKRKKLECVDTFFGGDILQKRENLIKGNKGIAGIGHVRYGTAGIRDYNINALQPFTKHDFRRSRRFSFAWNGHLSNYSELEAEILRTTDFEMEIGVDTEVLMMLFVLGLKQQQIEAGNQNFTPDFFQLCKYVMPKLDGAYSLVMLMGNGDLGVMRDKNGFKPLVYGIKEGRLEEGVAEGELHSFASESISLRQLEIRDFEVVEPGNAMLISDSGVKQEKILRGKRKAHCVIESVYFMDEGSHFEKVPVYGTRTNYGLNLAKNEFLADEFKKYPLDFKIVPVPISANVAAKSYGKYFGLDITDALKKITSKRTYINSPEKRDDLLKRTYDLKDWMVRGKKVVIIEDSLIKFSTIKKIISLLKKAEVKEIHVRSTLPPVIHPCFYGVDHSDYYALIANKFPQDVRDEKIAEMLGIASVRFQALRDLVKGTSLGKDNLCLACLNGDYPTVYGNIRAKEAYCEARRKERELFL